MSILTGYPALGTGPAEVNGVSRVHERILVNSRCHLDFSLHAAVGGLAEVEVSFAGRLLMTLPFPPFEYPAAFCLSIF